MKEFFKNIRSDKITNVGFLTTATLIAVIFIFTLFVYRRLPPFIPVFNQLPWGEERLGSTITIFLPLLITLSIFVINLIIGTLVYEKIPLVSRMLAGTSILTAALTFLFVVKTVILIL